MSALGIDELWKHCEIRNHRCQISLEWKEEYCVVLLSDYDTRIVHIPSDNKRKRLHDNPLIRAQGLGFVIT